MSYDSGRKSDTWSFLIHSIHFDTNASSTTTTNGKKANSTMICQPARIASPSYHASTAWCKRSESVGAAADPVRPPTTHWSREYCIGSKIYRSKGRTQYLLIIAIVLELLAMTSGKTPTEGRTVYAMLTMLQCKSLLRTLQCTFHFYIDNLLSCI